MNLWLSSNFLENIKIKRLILRLGDGAVLSLLRLWFYAGDYAIENLLDDDQIGILKDFNDDDIEMVGEWKGEKGVFINVLKSFDLIERKHNQYFIHDLLDNNPQIAVLIKQKISGSKYAKKRWERKRIGDPLSTPLGDSSGDPMQKEKKRKEKKKKEKEIDLPDWLNKKVWAEWIQYKKEAKKKMTPTTVKAQITSLFNLSKNKADHVAIIRRSIKNGWQGLFKLPENHVYDNPPPPTEEEEFFKSLPDWIVLNKKNGKKEVPKAHFIEQLKAADEEKRSRILKMAGLKEYQTPKQRSNIKRVKNLVKGITDKTEV